MATTTYGIYTSNRRQVQTGRANNTRVSGGAKKPQTVRKGATGKGKK